jgi:hypothetical protein
MKTIEVTDEQHEFLMNLSKEMNTQDNRCTARVMFTVFQKKKVYGVDPEYTDDTEIIEEDDPEDTLEWIDVINRVNNMNEDVDEDDDDFILMECYHHDKQTCEECVKDENWGSFSLPDGFKEIGYVVNNMVYVDNFFSEKAAQAHIDQNHYHYKEPYVYGTSAWRNPEIETLQEILKAINPVKKEEKVKAP